MCPKLGCRPWPAQARSPASTPTRPGFGPVVFAWYRPVNRPPSVEPKKPELVSPDGETTMRVDFLSPTKRPDALGRLGHYEVLELLGRGGFGIVLRAFDETLQRVVAVKVLAPELAATSPARKRFLREARSSAQIRHDNVVQRSEEHTSELQSHVN